MFQLRREYKYDFHVVKEYLTSKRNRFVGARPRMRRHLCQRVMADDHAREFPSHESLYGAMESVGTPF
jgi:hypothetical protein